MKKNNVIYIIRHGETIWNQEKLLQGRQDIPLSENGVQQAYEMSEYFKTKSIDFVGASPLGRTQQTASILSKELNIPVKTFDNLKARHYGPWEGKTIDAIREDYRELFVSLSLYSKEETFSKSPLDSIESYKLVSSRALKVLYEVESNALLVTHSGVITSILLALNFDHPQVPLIGHTGYVKLSHKDGQLFIEDVQGLSMIKRPVNDVVSEPMFIF